MTSPMERRVRKLEGGSTNLDRMIYQFTIPPDMTFDQAIERLGIEANPGDLLVEAVWLDEERGGKPELLSSGLAAAPRR